MKKNVVFSLLGAFVCSSALFVNAENAASVRSNILTPDSTTTEKCDSAAQSQKESALALALFDNDSVSTDSTKAPKAEATLALLDNDSVSTDSTQATKAEAALLASCDTVANDTAKKEAAASLMAYTDSVATDTTKAEPVSAEAKAETLLALL